tara:strand:- start:3328 stop:3810 length:483 start_codon:yes stop_codon:yes gene_type:complete
VALIKVIGSGVQGIANASDATFLTATSSEGVTLAGTLAVTGVHTVGNNAIATSEGGAATLNVTQGLAKAWNKGDSDTTRLDSFNLASNTDNGTGDYSYAFTSAMSNANYSIAASAQYANISGPDYAEQATGTYTVHVWSRLDSLTNDNSKHTQIIAGDLA